VRWWLPFYSLDLVVCLDERNDLMTGSNNKDFHQDYRIANHAAGRWIPTNLFASMHDEMSLGSSDTLDSVIPHLVP